MIQIAIEKVKVNISKLTQVFYLAGTPHSIALGVAIGIAWDFIPSIGIGMIISPAMAKSLKGNPIAAFTSNIAFGFFIPLFYSINILVGKFLTGLYITPVEIEETLQTSLIESLEGIEVIVEQPVNYFYLDRLQEYTRGFFVGAFFNAFAFGIFAYIIVLLLFKIKNSIADKILCGS